MPTPSTFYQNQVAYHQRVARQLRARYDRLSLFRLVAFVGLVAGAILLGSYSIWYLLIAVMLVIPVVGWAVRAHMGIGRAADYAERRVALAEGELAALENDFSRFASGDDYRDPGHAYSGDLDVFGDDSLFQAVARTVTRLGSDRLARDLSAPLPPEVIEARQRAIQEVADMPDWGLDFRARSPTESATPTQHLALLDWVQRPPLVKQDKLLTLFFWLAPVLTVAGLYWMLFHQPWGLGLLALLPSIWYLRKYKKEADALHEATAVSSATLSRYQQLILAIESAEWASPWLQQTQDSLGQGREASKALRRLSYYIRQLDLRYNPFSILLELTSLWSLRWHLKLDQWRVDHRDQLADWLNSLAEVDALCSWANLRFNQPGWAWPHLTTKEQVAANALGHPLIDPGLRVTNDFSCATDGHIQLVTGSNMAGKSTWLRTVGINMVLAQAGGPVCAQRLEMPPLQVWTSMRTQDALSDQTSSFFAELKRLKAIIQAVESKQENVFFLLDEILKGTNSRDRHTGARALIRQLIRAEGAGIIATHDLELAEMEKEAGSRVENYAMEVEIVDGKLQFDYTLKRGVSQSFNATLLMAQMGIKIDPEDISLHHD